MGFLDKTIAKAKATAKSTSSKYNESRDASKIRSQIRAEKEKVRECYDGDESHKDCFGDLVDRINASRKTIEDLEAQLEEVRVKGQEERDSIKANQDAEIEEIEASDAEAKALKEQMRKDKEDVF